MKESRAIKFENKFVDFISQTLLKKIIIQIVYLIMGILVSRGAILGNYAPFGTAFIAAVPYINIWTGLIGTIIGYLLPSSINNSLKYISSVIAIVAIRWTLNDLKKVKTHPLYAPLTAMLPTLAMGLTVAFIQGINGVSIIVALTESMLSAAGAYFFSRTIRTAKNVVGISTMDQQEFACAAMSVFILLLSVVNLSIDNISIGRIIAILIILFCAKYAGVAGGSVAGIAAGIVFSISSSDFMYLSGSYAFSGMMSGLFSPIGKIGVSLAFIVSNAIVSFESGQADLVISGIYEVMISTILFMLIPKSMGDKLSGILSKKSEHINADGLRNSVVMRLKFVAKALSSISDSVDSVSKKLSKLSSSDVRSVFTKSINNTCHRCGLKMFCWEREQEETTKSLSEVRSVLLKNGSIIEKDLSEKFYNRCPKSSEMVNSINKYYDEHIVKEAAENRMNEIREILGEQFSSMGELLFDISREFEYYERFDTEIADKIMDRLRKIGALPIEVSCRIDKFERLSVEIEFANTDSRKLNKFTLSKEISKSCGRLLDTPCISYTPDRCRVQVSERPRYDVDIASAQHVCNDGKLCGDNYCYFNDGMGRMISIISDGMGTGGRAAVDGAMTTGIISKLVKSGLSFNTSLKIVNSALIVKAGEESLSTIDISCIDLFTGKVDVMKAGAPITFVKRNGSVICIEAPSLPVGILTNIDFSTESIGLGEDDIVLMISDGAIATGDVWIEEELKTWNKHDISDLANLIIDGAVNRRLDGHDDDITVIAMRIKEY